MAQSHNLLAAIANSGLSEDELYFIVRFSAHHGYSKAIDLLTPTPWWRKAIKWVVHPSGWTAPLLMQWDDGKPPFSVWKSYLLATPAFVGENRWIARLKRLAYQVKSPTPLSFFGGFLSIIRWNLIDIDLSSINKKWGYLCITSIYADTFYDKIYWSPNATPNHPDAKIFWRRNLQPRN